MRRNEFGGGYDALFVLGNTSAGTTTSDADPASFTVVDVETTGLRAAEHRVLSIAALTLDATGRVVREFHTLLDPGCDPGPVHIHGLTREALKGAPVFDQVRDQLSELLADRVMVAHNARFDYGFLAREFDLSGGALPVRRRLCTLALARRVAPPTPDCKLGTLATYYGVPQSRAHDALDDARVLVGVLRALTADAARLGIALPMLRCAPDERPRYPRTPESRWPAESRWPVERRGPKSPCRYDYPGRYHPGGRLAQGMKVAFTGDTVAERADLVARAESAGLDVTGAVSALTSLLVCNEPDRASTKWRRARECGTPVVTETTFLTLLADIEPGRPKTDQHRRPTRPPRTRPAESGEAPLTGRRRVRARANRRPRRGGTCEHVGGGADALASEEPNRGDVRRVRSVGVIRPGRPSGARIRGGGGRPTRSWVVAVNSPAGG